MFKYEVKTQTKLPFNLIYNDNLKIDKTYNNRLLDLMIGDFKNLYKKTNKNN